MSNYWSRIAAMIYNDDDSKDRLDRIGVKLSSIEGGSDTKGEYDKRRNQHSIRITADHNLPTETIEVSDGYCHGCGFETIDLGNKLCVKCWDFVVDNASANAKRWPNEMQFRTFKLAQRI